MDRVHRLWAAVLCQAYEDLRDEEFQSYWWNQAAAFFFSPGTDWVASRRDICDFLGLEPADIRRPALRLINARRLEQGLPPLQTRPVCDRPRPPEQRVAEPAVRQGPPPPLPRLVATFNPAPEPPQRGRHRSWRERWAFNPFAPLPSERDDGKAA